MIKKLIKIASATCDACKKSLYVKGMREYGPEYGELTSYFGYGSKYDNIGAITTGRRPSIVICEKCWEKAFAAIEYDPTKLAS